MLVEQNAKLTETLLLALLGIRLLMLAAMLTGNLLLALLGIRLLMLAAMLTEIQELNLKALLALAMLAWKQIFLDFLMLAAMLKVNFVLAILMNRLPILLGHMFVSSERLPQQQMWIFSWSRCS